jgi:hypothetical protein
MSDRALLEELLSYFDEEGDCQCHKLTPVKERIKEIRTRMAASQPNIVSNEECDKMILKYLGIEEEKKDGN